MTTRILTAQESQVIAKKFEDKVSAAPLVFSRAEDATSPFVIEVTRGQAADGKTLVIHIFKRLDVPKSRAIEVVQHALIDVFGAETGAQADCDYRDVAALKRAYGREMVVDEPFDSLTIIFRPGLVVYTRTPNWVRDQMALALTRWYRSSLGW
jgi:hypothetical protein